MPKLLESYGTHAMIFRYMKQILWLIWHWRRACNVGLLFHYHKCRLPKKDMPCYPGAFKSKNQICMLFSKNRFQQTWKSPFPQQFPCYILTGFKIDALQIVAYYEMIYFSSIPPKYHNKVPYKPCSNPVTSR